MKTLIKISPLFLLAFFLLPACEKDQAAPDPAPAKPSLSIETVKGPEKEDCGGFEWQVKFKLKDADKQKGWVVQKITFAEKVNNCDNSKRIDNTLIYWEAWEVLLPRNTDSLWYLGNGSYDDMYRSPAHPDSKGSKDVKGQVKFFTDQNLPNTFKKNNPDTYAGGLPSTKEKPDFWNETDALNHDLNTTWVCCGDQKSTTQTTTPEVKNRSRVKLPTGPCWIPSGI